MSDAFLNKFGGISSATCDSRKVQKNSLFVAIKGNSCNGEDYIPEAIANGARFILLSGDKDDIRISNGITYIYSTDLRKMLAVYASAIYQKAPNNLVVVTGTNGKSSTVDFIRQLLTHSGRKCATIGTLGVTWPDGHRTESQGTLTTPDPLVLGQLLGDIKGNGIDYLAMEASSHGIEQYRMYGRKFRVAAFTNFSQDHLDYHKTMEAYFNAKMLLFQEYIDRNTICVLNADIDCFADIKKRITQNNILTYGLHQGDVHIKDIVSTSNGYDAKIVINNSIYSANIPIKSHYQLYNILCSITCLVGMRIPVESIISGLPVLCDVPGRMQAISVGNKTIYVDYAHTPEALRNAILDVRKNCSGRLFLVFGCGGNRDKSKRKIMGEIASQLSDVTVVTDDNPRHENADSIRADIISGCSGAIDIGDRQEAIKYAIEQSSDGDCILVAGKGHEKYQIVGDDIRHFDDVEEVRKICFVDKENDHNK